LQPLTDKKIHIICFDVPYPPDYGGAVDMFYKINALYKAGVKIHLHCFSYGRKESEILNSLCETVTYYKRSFSISRFLSFLPFIVVSRKNNNLLMQLKQDEFPVLMEGIHTTLYVDELIGRKIIVRSHNLEHDYYGHLSINEKNIFRKLFFYIESVKLKNYERVLKKTEVASISRSDTEYIKSKYGKAFYLPAFHSFEEVKCEPGSGDYALYHGNLSVNENDKAAIYLVKEVFSKIDYPLIIAGNKASGNLRKLIAENKNIQLSENNDINSLELLIKNAHINILPSFQATGIKLKLINALFVGRHCIVNSPMVKDTGLEHYCIVADSSEAIINAVKELIGVPFSFEQSELRKELLMKEFNNAANVSLLLDHFI
jgi:hypothetical protein